MKSDRIKLVIAVVLFVFAIVIGHGSAESSEDVIFMIATGDNLNCRMSANKHSYIVTVLERGQEIPVTGRWSKDNKWVEIDHPEYGKLWCSYQYLTERVEPFKVETLWDQPIKIRKQPVSGRVIGYLKKNRAVTITQVVLGWGKCSKGWIDLAYCIETGE